MVLQNLLNFKSSMKLTIISILLILCFLYLVLEQNSKYYQDDVTLITALFKIKSKYKFENYLAWVKSFLKINASMVFFIDKSIIKEVKALRPSIYQKKTIWIEMELQDFYSFKYYYKYFNESHNKDYEKKIHSVPLYLVWAEKCYFVRRAILRNYFKSHCFYWIDAGFFKNKNITKYFNNWPSKNKCIEDPRVIINSIRKISNEEIQGLKKLDAKFYNEFIKKSNVGGGLFGGNEKYLQKFIKIYYKTIKIFLKNSLFIGKDQNLFAYIAYLNQDNIKIIHSGSWNYLAEYLYINKK